MALTKELQRMQLQHVNVKLLVQNPEEANLEPLIPVFHSWIENQNGDELLIDVADYTHVPAGPGIVLIGHEGNYSVDNTGNRLGVRYNRKAAFDGGNQDCLDAGRPRGADGVPAFGSRNLASAENSALTGRTSKSSSMTAWSPRITPRRAKHLMRTSTSFPGNCFGERSILFPTARTRAACSRLS